MELDKPIKIRAYARLVGVSDTSVHKAMRSGKITAASWVEDKRGNKLIIPAKANAEWGRYHDPTKAQATKSGGVLNLSEAPPTAPPEQPTAPTQQASAPPNEADELSNKGLSVARLKQISETLKIKKAQIELKELEGTLVPKKQVYDAFFTFGQEMRQAILAIPDRIIDEIMATPERAVAHNILTDALMQALSALSDMGNRDISKRK